MYGKRQRVGIARWTRNSPELGLEGIHVRAGHTASGKGAVDVPGIRAKLLQNLAGKEERRSGWSMAGWSLGAAEKECGAARRGGGARVAGGGCGMERCRGCHGRV